MQNLSSSSLLGIKSKFLGEILFDNILRLEGEVTGKIVAKSSNASVLLIGKHAVVKADIVADIVIVAGQFTGTAYVPVKLEIKKKGKCDGMIFTSDLVVQKKSTFHGQCFMLKHLDDKEKNSIKLKLLGTSHFPFFLISNLTGTYAVPVNCPATITISATISAFTTACLPINKTLALELLATILPVTSPSKRSILSNRISPKNLLFIPSRLEELKFCILTRNPQSR